MYKILNIVLWGILIQSVQGQVHRSIKCFECDSLWDPHCAAPFDNRTFNLATCPPDSNMCSVTVHVDEDRYIRQCAKSGTILQTNHCLMGPTEDDDVKRCHCDHKDGCNQITIEKGQAHRTVRCYECDSLYEPRCAAPFDNRTFFLSICPPDSNMCSVTFHVDEDRYIRQCAKSGTILQTNHCLMGPTEDDNVKRCHCDHKDGCNQITIEKGQAHRTVRCYECDSLYEPRCAAPFDNRTFFLSICPPDSNMCSVTFHVDEDRYIRQCAKSGTILQANHCLMGPTEDDNVKRCYCDHKDGCNQNTIEKGLAHRTVRCYECDSLYEPRCAAPFDNRTFFLSICPPDSNMCSVTFHIDEDRYIRQCAKSGTILQTNHCLMGPTEDDNVKRCYCDHKDGCNQNTIEKGEAHRTVRCYECDSLYEPRCAAPFDNRTFNLAICPPDSNMCSVTVHIDEDRYIRQCAKSGTILQTNHCLMGPTEDNNVKRCHCDHKDGCNQNTVEKGQIRRTIRCYECTSLYDPNCAAPFDNRTLPLSVCPPDSNMCSVTIHIDVGLYIRLCAKSGTILDTNQCLMGPTEDSNVKICHCDHKDGCNQNTIEKASVQSQSIPIRLPETVRPVHYNLTFHPQIYGVSEEEFISYGIAEIELLCTEETDTIRIHSKNLNWTKVELRNHQQEKFDVTLTDYLDEEIKEVKTDKHFDVNGVYHLYIEYDGPITDILKGFYYSPYKEGNTTKYIFTTMMEPTDARRVFPCFDEPDFKATFQINIIRQKSVTTLSNAQLDITEELDNDWLVDRYATSLRMSTYLVAFAIGDLEHLETTVRDIQFRTWSRKGTANSTEFALEIGCKLLKFFEDYFQIKYTMVKVDMVAVPTLIYNAMEHWGMITYRESGMFYDEGVSSESVKEWIAVLVSHELSHQWFGNLVSPKWWDDLWLNEGFATYMMFLAIDAILPDWKMMNKLPIDFRGVQNVMETDDSMTSHPVYIPVDHPDEINQIFDLISYAKGCAVIRMMNFFLGDKTFTEGLTFYLNEHSFSTATHNDLWDALETKSKENGNGVTDIKAVMDTWLLETNYPVVTINRTSATTFTLSQAAFLMDEIERLNRSNIFWEIPFAYTHEVEKDFDKHSEDIIWLHKDGGEVEVVDQTLTESSWIIGNIQQYGYFRVQYGLENWNAILNQLKTNHLVIHPINRAQIISDAWNLARAGLLSFDIALKTLEYLDQEVDYVPWKAASRVLNYLRRSLQLTPAYGDFVEFMRKKLGNAYTQSMEANTHYAKIQGYLIASQACTYGVDACVNRALEEFQLWMSNSSYWVDPDLKVSIYCTGVRLGDASVWEKVLQRYKEPTASERYTLLHALACVKEPWIIKKFLDLTISTSIFSKTDIVDAVSYIVRHPIGRLMAWDFVVENWDFYFEKYGSGTNLFTKLINSLTGAYNTAMELKKVETFVQEHEDLGTASREFHSAIAKIKLNIAWMEKEYYGLQNWLREQV